MSDVTIEGARKAIEALYDAAFRERDRQGYRLYAATRVAGQEDPLEGRLALHCFEIASARMRAFEDAMKVLSPGWKPPLRAAPITPE